MKNHPDPAEKFNALHTLLRQRMHITPATSKQWLFIGATMMILFLILCGFFMIKPSTKKNTTYQNLPEEPMVSHNLSTLKHTQKWLNQHTTNLGTTQLDPMTHTTLPSTQPHSTSSLHLAKNRQTRQNSPTTVYEQPFTKQNLNVTKDVKELEHSHAPNAPENVTDYQRRFAVTLPTAMIQKTVHHPDDTIMQGEFIQATLETAIHSDLPGYLRAVVTHPVYSYSGKRKLIQAGSRLIGQYASMQSGNMTATRIFVLWNRLITPEGCSFQLNAPSIDNLGRAGLTADQRQTHFWTLFGTTSLLSVLALNTTHANTAAPHSINPGQTLWHASAHTAQETLQNNLAVKPTLHVHQGTIIKIFVNQDLDFFTSAHQPHINIP